MAYTWQDGELVTAAKLNNYGLGLEEIKEDCEDAQGACEDAQTACEAATVHQPIVQNGTWWTWDQTTSAYVDTSVSATGQTTAVVTYQEGTSGTVAPTGSWSPTVPTVAQGNYLWTKTVFNELYTTYSVARQGVDGEGSGDMSKSVYDTNDNGIVDNAEKLGGQSPEYYATAEDLSAKYTASNASASARGLVKYAQGTFTISANDFTADSTYEDYPFRKAIAVSGCTSDHFADVCFDLASATGGKIAPVCETYDGGFYIYSKEQNAEQITGTYKVTYNA